MSCEVKGFLAKLASSAGDLNAQANIGLDKFHLACSFIIIMFIFSFIAHFFPDKEKNHVLDRKNDSRSFFI